MSVVGALQPGLPRWTASSWLPLCIPLADLLVTAASLTAVSLLEALSIARALADSLSSRPEPARELLGAAAVDELHEHVQSLTHLCRVLSWRSLNIGPWARSAQCHRGLQRPEPACRLDYAAMAFRLCGCRRAHRPEHMSTHRSLASQHQPMSMCPRVPSHPHRGWPQGMPRSSALCLSQPKLCLALAGRKEMGSKTAFTISASPLVFHCKLAGCPMFPLEEGRDGSFPCLPCRKDIPNHPSWQRCRVTGTCNITEQSSMAYGTRRLILLKLFTNAKKPQGAWMAGSLSSVGSAMHLDASKHVPSLQPSHELVLQLPGIHSAQCRESVEHAHSL